MKTATITFEGMSDDTFGWTGFGPGLGDDHDDCGALSVRSFQISHKSLALIVTGVYGAGAPTWSVGIAPVDDNEPLPPWPMKWRFEGYSTILEIECPEDCEIKLACPTGDD